MLNLLYPGWRPCQSSSWSLPWQLQSPITQLYKVTSIYQSHHGVRCWIVQCIGEYVDNFCCKYVCLLTSNWEAGTFSGLFGTFWQLVSPLIDSRKHWELWDDLFPCSLTLLSICYTMPGRRAIKRFSQSHKYWHLYRETLFDLYDAIADRIRSSFLTDMTIKPSIKRVFRKLSLDRW